MYKTFWRLGLTLALVGLTGIAFAAPRGHEPERGVQHSHAVQARQVHNARQWQHQQRVVQHQRAVQQQHRDAAWQRQNLAWQRRQVAIERQRAIWQRGQHYHGSYVVVNNYGRYGLHRPERGYHWVRVNNQYLLVAMATQLIVEAINS